MIEVKDIRKSFGELEVLHGVSLTVSEGEIVSIVGASGAGKTTLLQIMGSLMPADSGEVIIDGVSLASLSDDALSEFRNKRIGFIFQSYHLLPEFSAMENVMMPMLISGVKRRVAEERARELLAMVSMSHRLEHKPSALSGGEQQRVAIARALVNKPAVVLADEPTGNLDSETRNDIQQLFFELRERTGQTFVIVTHDSALADGSDRKITMKDGEII
ncbi:MAG: ABC transporter ATP-binding protein [Alistipes sp.]|jgi:lipoprotein-releasing system ATP-binding protein|nr:ABC transporter ATP-binding protein [Alistipes sp.]MBO5855881.1 ABC transporter ATP-binding protein [Alistipes sp.]